MLLGRERTTAVEVVERLAGLSKCARGVVRRGPIIIKTALPGASEIFTFAHVRVLNSASILFEKPRNKNSKRLHAPATAEIGRSETPADGVRFSSPKPAQYSFSSKRGGLARFPWLEKRVKLDQKACFLSASQFSATMNGPVRAIFNFA